MLPVHFPITIASANYECFSLMPDGEDNRRTMVIQGEQIRAPLSSKYLAKDPTLPGGRHEWQYTCETQALLKQVRSFFLDTARGRGIPFWFPTWEFDLIVASTVPSPYNLSIWDGGYLNSYWSLGEAFRWILLAQGANYTATKLNTISVDNPIPGWDSFGRSGDYGGAVPSWPWTEANSVRALWLRYGRFDLESFSVDTFSGGGGLVRLAIVECNDEAP